VVDHGLHGDEPDGAFKCPAGGGEWSRRHSALDYQTPEFSRNGSTWFDGTLVTVFRPGWTNRSEADDGVARWSSPFDATMVRIRSAAGLARRVHGSTDPARRVAS
jgi:hypothetical protein